MISGDISGSLFGILFGSLLQRGGRVSGASARLGRQFAPRAAHVGRGGQFFAVFRTRQRFGAATLWRGNIYGAATFWRGKYIWRGNIIARQSFGAFSYGKEGKRSCFSGARKGIRHLGVRPPRTLLFPEVFQWFWEAPFEWKSRNRVNLMKSTRFDGFQRFP